MRMIGSDVNLELFAHLSAELVLRQHAANRRFEYPFRMSLHQFLGGHFFEPAGPTGVMPVDLVLQLVSSEYDFFSVDDDNVIAHVQEWRIGCLVFTHQQSRCDGCEPAYGLAVGVDDKPVAGLLEVLPARNECLHDTNLQIPVKKRNGQNTKWLQALSRHLKTGGCAPTINSSYRSY